MTSGRIAVLLLVSSCVSMCVYAEDIRAKYAGRDSCTSELWGPVGNFGIRLDRSQRAYLAAHTVAGEKVLMIVQYAHDGDKCGVIKDVIAAAEAKSYFEFDCIDSTRPGTVVVGTWPDNNSGRTATALESWRVELETLTFARATSKVICTRRGGSSVDRGEDLVGRAKMRAAKKKANKNVPEK